MSEKKTWNRAVKDDHFDLLVTFQRCDDFVELRNCVRAKNVEGRVINRYAPIRGRSSRQKNLFVAHIYRYSALCLAQRLERRAKLGHENFRTFREPFITNTSRCARGPFARGLPGGKRVRWSSFCGDA